MQNPNEDTQWNDALRRQGIIPQKPQEAELTEDEIVKMMTNTIKEKTGAGPGGVDLEKLSLGELEELEDEEEERVLMQYKAKRLMEMKSHMALSRFGSVIEISAQDYVQQVNKAGEGIWVILHLYRQGVPLCALINQYLNQLAMKFPTTKFIKSISTVCIPNYPDKNLPTIFVYFEGEMKEQFIGPISLRGMNLTIEELEYLLGKSGAIPSTIKRDPKPKIEDKMMSSLGVRNRGDESDSGDDEN